MLKQFLHMLTGWIRPIITKFWSTLNMSTGPYSIWSSYFFISQPSLFTSSTNYKLERVPVNSRSHPFFEPRYTGLRFTLFSKFTGPHFCPLDYYFDVWTNINEFKLTVHFNLLYNTVVWTIQYSVLYKPCTTV